jgi:Ca2+-binding RTX toxin-like protein
MRFLAISGVLGAIVCAVWAGAAAGAPPANDSFTAAELLDATKGSVIGTTKGATKQPGEPNHAGNPGGASVWYRLIAGEDVILALTTAGSTFDTLLAVYTGTSLQSLTEVASNDDVPGADTSLVRFNADAGTEYFVAVDGYGGDFGALTLAWSEAPRNDSFDQAETIGGEAGAIQGTNQDTTAEPGEPLHAGVEGATSVWYRWTAPRSGMFRFETFGSEFDTVLAVYTGEAVSALTPVAGNDDFLSLQSAVSFQATGGTVYSIAVTGWVGQTGAFVLTWYPGAILIGTDAADTLTGTPGADYIDGGDGHDRLSGSDGDDVVVGGAGNDAISGGDGDDFLVGGDGRDRLDGDDGSDRLDGRDGVPGNDTLRGGRGSDRCRADPGDRRRSCP